MGSETFMVKGGSTVNGMVGSGAVLRTLELEFPMCSLYRTTTYHFREIVYILYPGTRYVYILRVESNKAGCQEMAIFTTGE